MQQKEGCAGASHGFPETPGGCQPFEVIKTPLFLQTARSNMAELCDALMFFKNDRDAAGAFFFGGSCMLA